MNPSNDPSQTPSQFEKLLAGLARSGVDFAVVGGLAVILNGYPRLTEDSRPGFAYRKRQLTG